MWGRKLKVGKGKRKGKGSKFILIYACSVHSTTNNTKKNLSCIPRKSFFSHKKSPALAKGREKGREEGKRERREKGKKGKGKVKEGKLQYLMKQFLK